jgi:acyl-CoA synthetase (AMP-forming)/AMP-acid ligase II
MSQALTGEGELRQAGLASIPEVVHFHATVRPDKVAVLFDERELTFAELDRYANRVARALVGQGFQPGDRFAIVDKNRIEFYPLLIGGLKAGGIHVAVNWRLTTAEMSHIVNDAGVHTLFVG